nr:reverse transcriptase domain-containing protein [Tanacetum cinerariifolium]
MMLGSVEHGPLIKPTIKENGVTRTKKYVELFDTEKIQAYCNLKETNIILQGLPSDNYSLVNHHRVAKDLWEKVKLLMQGHIARQCPKPKRRRDATWFREKVLLVEARRNGKVLNEEELEFLEDPGIIEGAAHRWLEKEPPRSILTWEDLVSKFINEFFPPSRTTNLRNKISNFQQRFDASFHEAWDQYKDLLRACPHHGFTELHQLDTFYNALNPVHQDSLNSAAGGNLLERRTQDVLTVIENKSKIAKLAHAVNQQTSAVTTAMTTILKQFQATPPPASIKAVEEICVTCGGAHLYYQCLTVYGNTFSELRDNIQEYVSAAAVNYNQGSGLLPSNTIAKPKGELKSITTRSGIFLDGPFVPMPPPFINPKEDKRVEETLTDQDLAEYTVKVPPPLVQKPKPPFQINFVIHQKDPLHPNIPYPSRMHKQKQQEKDEVQIHKFWQMFKQLHINITLADALILIPKYHKMLKALLSNKEKLLELANTPLNENCSAVILKKLPEKLGDLGKFLIPCGFRRPFLRTARALIDVHGEEMILRDGDERLTLNMRHDTSSYSNQPQKESINIINIYDDSCGDFLEDLFTTNHQSGSPTFSSHSDLTSSELKMISLIRKEACTTSSSPNHLLEEFADELALITFPPRNDDLPFDIESDLKEIEYLLNHDPIKEIDSILEDSIDASNLANLNDNLVDTMPEMFIDEHALDYSSSPLYDEYDDDLFEVESDTEYVYDDPFDFKGEKIKESKLLIDELDLSRSSDFLPSPEYDSFLFEDFSEVDDLPSTNNGDKVFNLGILIQENIFEVITRIAPHKNVKKLAISHASLILEDFDPPLSLYEPPFLKEVPGSETLLLFSSKNEEKVFKPGILTSKRVHSSLLLEISHRGHKVFKIIKILESPMEIFPCFCRENIRILDVPCLHYYPL